MLERIFLEVCNMTLTGSCVILIILAARMLMRRMPRVYSYALWGIAALRLLCPFSLESARALIPVKAEPFTPEIFYADVPQIDSGITVLDQVVNATLPAPTTVAASVNPVQIAMFITALIWLAGMLVLVACNVLALMRLRRSLRGAESIGENCFASTNMESPFVLGFVRPRIYLPSSLDADARELILLHERAHIRRYDHLAKLLGFVVLAVHWFNPLVWIAFRCFERDMEMSCDEAVLRNLAEERRADYSTLLLSLATGRRFAAPHLAFGESDTGTRIKHILRYRRPAVWVGVIALIAVIVLCGCMLFSPAEQEQGEVLFAAETLSGMRFVDGKNSVPSDKSALDLVLRDVTIEEMEREAVIRFNHADEIYTIRAVPISSVVRGGGSANAFIFAPTAFDQSNRYAIAQVRLNCDATTYDLMDVNTDMLGQTVLSVQLWEMSTGDMLYWQGEVELQCEGEPSQVMRALTSRCMDGRSAEEIAALVDAAPLMVGVKSTAAETTVLAELTAAPDTTAVLEAASTPGPDYVTHRITFPAYEQREGLHESWYIDPFTFSIPLPEGWTVVEVSAEEKATAYGTPLYFYDGEKNMGSISFRTATWREDGAGNYFMYFQGYIGGSIINWGIDCKMVYDTGTSGVAVSKLAVNQMDGIAAAASTIKYYPAILAYLRDGDTILQVALSFAENAFDDDTLTAIAEHITLAKK